jgi:hypothetical protein
LLAASRASASPSSGKHPSSTHSRTAAPRSVRLESKQYDTHFFFSLICPYQQSNATAAAAGAEQEQEQQECAAYAELDRQWALLAAVEAEAAAFNGREELFELQVCVSFRGAIANQHLPTKCKQIKTNRSASTPRRARHAATSAYSRSVDMSIYVEL